MIPKLSVCYFIDRKLKIYCFVSSITLNISSYFRFHALLEMSRFSGLFRLH
jgi:hypothetical protein